MISRKFVVFFLGSTSTFEKGIGKNFFFLIYTERIVPYTYYEHTYKPIQKINTQKKRKKKKKIKIKAKLRTSVPAGSKKNLFYFYIRSIDIIKTLKSTKFTFHFYRREKEKKTEGYAVGRWR